tara:strand:+ start:636 stop:1955 length:1320 start_codon:yes stop_codon:yes gene_type:complete
MNLHKTIYLIFISISLKIFSQSVEFEKYTLENGLDVIIHQDNSAPVITTAVMYHIGAKDESSDKTGFAHFFEHLLFDGTKNIGKGEWGNLVNTSGGWYNANTSADRTYYYNVFPSNNLELSLWLESERMLHPIISQSGIDVQREVVKEEKRMGENGPYAKLMDYVQEEIFEIHPYGRTVIGEIEHLNSAELNDFLDFNKRFHVPNNAVLVVAGDISLDVTKKLVRKYFGDIPKGKDVVRNLPIESPIKKTKYRIAYDKNIQIPAKILAYRTPSMKTKDSRVLDLISTYLSDGGSSVLYSKLIDDKKIAIEVFASNIAFEEYGFYMIGALPLGESNFSKIQYEIDIEIEKLKTKLISKKSYKKIQNMLETSFVSRNSNMEGIANSLAKYHLLYGNVNLINNEINLYKEISREDIRQVAKKYLNTNQRVELDYLPEKSTND